LEKQRRETESKEVRSDDMWSES